MTHYHPTSNTFKSANPLANVLPPEQQQLPLFYWKGNFFPLNFESSCLSTSLLRRRESFNCAHYP